ncbi:MAG: ABC transporter permease [Phycisphaerae bacterium]|nr:ABC transporter permease [Phycisphaerae bacterium]
MTSTKTSPPEQFSLEHTGEPLRLRFFAILQSRSAGVIAALAILIILGSFLSDGFLDGANLLNVGQQISLVGIMAVGMTFLIITGEIDLSVGAIYALSSVITGLAITSGVSWPIAVLLGVVVGGLCGLVNGALTVYLNLPSFIVTLGTLSIFRGVMLLTTGGSPISLDSSLPEVASFAVLGSARPFGVPIQLILFTTIAVIGGLVLAFARFGFHVYGVGGSRESARLTGVRTDAVRLAAFCITGALSGIAGIVGLAFLLYVQGTSGTGLELLVITAVIVGGTALFGGSGTILGTVAGVALIGVLQNVLILGGVSSFVQTIVVGAVIIIAVALDTRLRRRRRT